MKYQHGNTKLLNSKKLGLLASRQEQPEISGMLPNIINGITQSDSQVLVSGWHSPIERRVHDRLVREYIPHIHVGAKSLEKMTCELPDDDVLFLTDCAPGVNRISRQTALHRNRSICEISSSLLIPWLNPSGDTHRIVKEWCDKKPVYVFDSLYNIELIKAGAKEILPFFTG